jgi:exonuclease SbcC
MPFTVRVQNFQSIKDATIEVDGFTVVTGPNNSGKTALQRAIRGVFTNSPPGPLVRHGEAHLTVTITFEDGQTVKWEKGWKKPNQKGGTINRYTVNGKELKKVGRGVPQEVLAMGVKPIKAGDRTLWPQIADQFSGVLFLVDTPGSVIAEAIADVDRVGQLSTALKLSESDRRSSNSTLKVRRTDEDKLALELATYEGLDTVANTVTRLQETAEEAVATHTDLETCIDLRDRHDLAAATRRRLSGIREVQIPEKKRIETTVKTGAAIRSVGSLRKRLAQAAQESTRLAPAADIEVPTEKVVKKASSTKAKLTFATGLHDRLATARQSRLVLVEVCTGLDGLALTAETPKPLTEAKTEVAAFTSLQKRLDTALEDHATLLTELATAEADVVGAQEEVEALLGDMGECPTCGTTMDAEHLGAHA